jgi:hypothetical protein
MRKGNLAHLAAPNDSIRFRSYDALRWLVAVANAARNIERRHYNWSWHLPVNFFEKGAGQVKAVVEIEENIRQSGWLWIRYFIDGPSLPIVCLSVPRGAGGMG